MQMGPMCVQAVHEYIGVGTVAFQTLFTSSFHWLNPAWQIIWDIRSCSPATSGRSTGSPPLLHICVNGDSPFCIPHAHTANKASYLVFPKVNQSPRDKHFSAITPLGFQESSPRAALLLLIKQNSAHFIAFSKIHMPLNCKQKPQSALQRM